MVLHLGLSTTLGLAVILNLLAPAQTQRVASESLRPAARMFSPWYGESLRSVLRLEQSDALRLEQQLAQQPNDSRTRLKLMAYYQRADRAVHSEDIEKRTQHVFWLIEHDPRSEILHSYVSSFSPGQLKPADYERAVGLWRAASKAHPGDAAIHWNAASFFDGLDSDLVLHYLEATVAADPNHPSALRPLAHRYALSILEGGRMASRAQTALDASRNVWVLGNAAYMFQSQYNASGQRGSPNDRAAQLAERYFLRAKALDATLDRTAILPQLDAHGNVDAQQNAHQVRRTWEARAAEGLEKVRRLPADSFPELPASIASVLRARNCSMPQPTAKGTPRNVIRGDFFAKGQSGWAVLCSVNNSTALLAFRDDNDANPDVLSRTEDRSYLQPLDQDEVRYSREISSAGRDSMIGHYRAYGGPEPPPIDHHGIDDAFLEKASVTWYFHHGKWLRLQGAD